MEEHLAVQRSTASSLDYCVVFRHYDLEILTRRSTEEWYQQKILSPSCSWTHVDTHVVAFGSIVRHVAALMSAEQSDWLVRDDPGAREIDCFCD